MEAGATFRIDRSVPRTEHVEPHPLPPLFQPSRHGRHDRLLHGVVEPLTIRRCLVEAILRLVRVIPVVREARVLRHLFSQHELPVEDLR